MDDIDLLMLCNEHFMDSIVLYITHNDPVVLY